MPQLVRLNLGLERGTLIFALRPFEHFLGQYVCYKALKDIEPYWQGAKRVPTVMGQKAKRIADLLLCADEEMASVEVHRWPPKVFNHFKNTRETSTGPAAGAAAGASGVAAESGHHQGTTAGLLFRGCTEQDVQGRFQGEG